MSENILEPSSTASGPEELPALLAPSIRAAAEKMEQQNDLPEDLLAELRAAGAFRLFTPREYGGFEAPLTTALKVYEGFGRIDASVAWVVWNANWGFLAALLGETGAARLWDGAAEPVLTNAGQPGVAVPVEGGYRVSGDWKVVSGSNGADWIVTVGIVREDGAPRMTAAGTPDVRLFPVRRDQLTVRSTWNVSGLRGSGSNQVVVEDVFVPDELVATSGRPARIDRPLYRGFIPALVFPGSAAVVLGVAQAALDETVRLVSAKTAFGGGRKLAELPHTQAVVARAQAALDAARLLLHAAAGVLDEAGVKAEPVTIGDRAGLRAAMSHAARVSRQVLVEMYELGSSSSLSVGGPVERLFRDGMVALQHFSLSALYFEAVGRVRFGADPGMPLF